MTTYLATTALRKPVDGARISKGKLAYLRARYKGNVHNVVLDEFEKSGISKAEIARRLGMRPEQITRLLASPSNMTLDTLSNLLFAIAGKEPDTKALELGEMDTATPVKRDLSMDSHTPPRDNQVRRQRQSG